jgi:bacterioferritin
MKGDDKVIEVLNEVLTAELTAINQYFIHAKMCQNWGFKKLYDFIRHESIDEMKHADEVIDRILFLEGVPNLQRLSKLNVGETVKEQFQADLALELAAIKRLNDGVKLFEQISDNGSRELLERILAGEEEHADWLETQLHLMATVGEAQYLAEQMG